MIRVGDRVAFKRSDATISDNACLAFGIDFIFGCKFKNKPFYKGTVTKIKTRKWLLFKLDKPVCVIDDYYLVSDIKPVISLRAILHS